MEQNITSGKILGGEKDYAPQAGFCPLNLEQK